MDIWLSEISESSNQLASEITITISRIIPIYVFLLENISSEVRFPVCIIWDVIISWSRWIVLLYSYIILTLKKIIDWIIIPLIDNLFPDWIITFAPILIIIKRIPNCILHILIVVSIYFILFFSNEHSFLLHFPSSTTMKLAIILFVLFSSSSKK